MIWVIFEGDMAS